MHMCYTSEKLIAGKNCEVSVVEKRCFALDSRWSNVMKMINVYVENYEAKALASLT